MKLTVHLYGDLLSENFQARTTVVLVAHLMVKFFGMSVELTRKEERKTKTKKQVNLHGMGHIESAWKERQKNLWV